MFMVSFLLRGPSSHTRFNIDGRISLNVPTALQNTNLQILNPGITLYTALWHCNVSRCGVHPPRRKYAYALGVALGRFGVGWLGLFR